MKGKAEGRGWEVRTQNRARDAKAGEVMTAGLGEAVKVE